MPSTVVIPLTRPHPQRPHSFLPQKQTSSAAVVDNVATWEEQLALYVILKFPFILLPFLLLLLSNKLQKSIFNLTAYFLFTVNISMVLAN